MRRLPVYFLVDVSESMVGESIQQVNEGMKSIVQELRTDPYALETVYASVIAFAGKAQSVVPLTDICKFNVPNLFVGSGTSLGVALNFLMDDMDKKLVKNTEMEKGDWKPLVFLFTDGMPTDNPSSAFARWNRKYRNAANLIAISIGNNVDTGLLGQISDNVFRLNGTDQPSFKQFFKWVTASVKATSLSVDSGLDDVKLASTSGINLEKVDGTESCAVDERYVVLLGKCSNTKQTYLMKYEKGAPFMGEYGGEYGLTGVYIVDEEAYNRLSDGKSNKKINTESLFGVAPCPCCGNPYGVVVCDCGNIMCSDGGTQECPWCGMEGSLGAIENGGLDIRRGRG